MTSLSSCPPDRQHPLKLTLLVAAVLAFLCVFCGSAHATFSTSATYQISFNGVWNPCSFTVQSGPVANNIPVPVNNGASLSAATGIYMDISATDDGYNDFQHIPQYPQGSANFNFSVSGPSGSFNNLNFSIDPLWGDGTGIFYDNTIDGTGTLGVLTAGNYNISGTSVLNIYGVNGAAPSSFWVGGWINYIYETMQFQSGDLMNAARTLSGLPYSVITDQASTGPVSKPGPIDFSLGTVNGAGVFNNMYGAPTHITSVPVTTTVTGAISSLNQVETGEGTDNWQLVGLSGPNKGAIMTSGTMNVYDLGTATITAPTGTIPSDIPPNAFINANVANSYPQSVTVMTIESMPSGDTQWHQIYSVNTTNGATATLTPVNVSMLPSQGLKLVDVVAGGTKYAISLFIGIPYNNVSAVPSGVTATTATAIQGHAYSPIPKASDVGWPAITWFQFSVPGSFAVAAPTIQVGVPASGANTPAGTIITQ